MTRTRVLAGLLGAGVLSMTVAAQQAPPRQAARAIQRVRDNLYMIPGSDLNTYPIGNKPIPAASRTASTGGNTAVWITATGVVLVDTMNPGYGAELLAQVRSVTDKPVTMVINSHTHFDHTGSNIDLPPTVEFVAHDNTKANLSKATCPRVTNCDAFKGDKAGYLPKRSFKDRMTLFGGRDRIDLYYFGPGHTNGDAWIVFPAVRAMHTGDMFQRRNLPFVDAADNDGDALRFADTLKGARQNIKDVDAVIPGHSPVPLTWKDFSEYVEFYEDYVSQIRQARQSGASVEAAAAQYRLPGRFASFEVEAPRVKQNAEAIYRALAQ